MNVDIIAWDNETADAVKKKLASLKEYEWHSDNSHEWLKVDLKELKDLGICKEISSFSYANNGNVYLEGDCDAGIFIDAHKKKLGIPHGEAGIKFIEINDGDISNIRSMSQFIGQYA